MSTLLGSCTSSRKFFDVPFKILKESNIRGEIQETGHLVHRPAEFNIPYWFEYDWENRASGQLSCIASIRVVIIYSIVKICGVLDLLNLFFKLRSLQSQLNSFTQGVILPPHHSGSC